MSLSIDYYLAPQSPWTYLGHARFVQMAANHGAQVRLKPVDLSKVFPVSGSLPLHLQTQHFPVPGEPAVRLIVAVQQGDGTTAALDIAGLVLAAVWAQQRNIASAGTLAELLAERPQPGRHRRRRLRRPQLRHRRRDLLGPGPTRLCRTPLACGLTQHRIAHPKKRAPRGPFCNQR